MIDFNSIYGKTEAGKIELTSQLSTLALDLYDILCLIDDKSTLEELLARTPSVSREDFIAAIAALEKDGLIALLPAAAAELVFEPLDFNAGPDASRDAPVAEEGKAAAADVTQEIKAIDEFAEGVKGEAQAPENSKFAESKRNVIATVLFLDIVEYTKESVSSQLEIKDQFNALVSQLIKNIPEDDRVILDTGDGAALGFLGDPEDVLFIAIRLRDALLRNDHQDYPKLKVRIGINLGPVRLVKDMIGRSNLIGDGVNDAQRVMSFAKAEQILVSRSFYDVVSRLSGEYADLFRKQGVHYDKHRRGHELYEIGSAEKRDAAAEEAQKKAKAKTEEEIQAERREKLKAKLDAAKAEEARAAANEEAMQAARREAEKKEKERAQKLREERQAAGKLAKKRSGAFKAIAGATVLLLLLAGGALPFVPLSGNIPAVEKLLSDRLHQPVTVSALHVALFPTPRFILQDVAVGRNMNVGKVTAMTGVSGIFAGSRDFSAVSLDGVTLNQDAVAAMSEWGSAEADAVHAAKVTLSNVKLGLGDVTLAAFDAEVDFAGNKIAHATIVTADKSLNADITASGENYAIALSAKAWQAPLGPAITWDDLNAKGVAFGSGLKFDDIEGSTTGGQLKGVMQLAWGSKWRAQGSFYGKGLELATLTPVFSSSARLKGALEIRANYALEAPGVEKLFDSPNLNATFKVVDGEIGNADIAAAIQPQSAGGGVTKIGELTGAVAVASGRCEYRQLQLSSGLLKAAGNIDISREQKLSGRLNVELSQFRSALGVAGSVAEPVFLH